MEQCTLKCCLIANTHVQGRPIAYRCIHSIQLYDMYTASLKSIQHMLVISMCTCPKEHVYLDIICTDQKPYMELTSPTHVSLTLTSATMLCILLRASITKTWSSAHSTYRTSKPSSPTVVHGTRQTQMIVVPRRAASDNAGASSRWTADSYRVIGVHNLAPASKRAWLVYLFSILRGCLNRQGEGAAFGLCAVRSVAPFPAEFREQRTWKSVEPFPAVHERQHA